MAILGYTSIGATNDNGDNDYYNWQRFTTDSTGGTTSVIKICAWQAAATGAVKLAIYNEDINNEPNTLLGYVTCNVTQTTKPTQDSEWTSGNLVVTLAANTGYWIAFSASAADIYIAYTTTGGTNRSYNGTNIYPSFPPSTATTSGSSSWQLSAYATYAPLTNAFSDSAFDSTAFETDGTGGTSGTLSGTDTPDSASLSGTTINSGTLSGTGPSDTSSFAGTTINAGGLTGTDTQDSAAIAGTTINEGTLDGTDTEDTADFAGTTINEGTLDSTDTEDTADFAGTTINSGSLAATDNPDTLVFYESAPTTTQSVRVSGAWKQIDEVFVRVSGDWKSAEMFVRDSGVWR